MNFWYDASMTHIVPPSTVVAELLLSFVLGQAVAWLYGFTHRGVTWSRNMVHSIVLLAMTVTLVMLLVGDSVARAFGLVGALAIIRFRTVVRDARDTTFIFLAIAVGIAVGVEQPGIAVAGTLIVGLVATVLHFTNFGSKHAENGVLRFRTTLSQERIEAFLGEWCTHIALLKQKPIQDSGQGQETEFSFEIRLYDPDDQEAIQSTLKSLGATSVALTIEQQAEEW